MVLESIGTRWLLYSSSEVACPAYQSVLLPMDHEGPCWILAAVMFSTYTLNIHWQEEGLCYWVKLIQELSQQGQSHLQLKTDEETVFSAVHTQGKKDEAGR